MIDQAIGALQVDVRLGTRDNLRRRLGHADLRRHIIQADLRQQLGIVFLLLPLLQGFRLLDDTLFVIFAHGLPDRSESRFLGDVLTLAELLIGTQGKTNAMLVSQQQVPDQLLDEIGVLDRFTQALDHGIEVEQFDRFAAVDGSRQAVEYELQAERVTVATDFTLAQFQLVQYRFKFLVRDTVIRDIPQHVEHQFLECTSILYLAALETTHETHLVVGIFQAAQRRRRSTQAGLLERMTQR